MKKALSMLLAVIMVLTLFAGCGEKPAPTPNEELSATQQIIKEAEGMTLEELAEKSNRRVQRQDLLRRWQLQPRQVCTASVH